MVVVDVAKAGRARGLFVVTHLNNLQPRQLLLFPPHHREGLLLAAVVPRGAGTDGGAPGEGELAERTRRRHAVIKPERAGLEVILGGQPSKRGSWLHLRRLGGKVS